jgi:hypothetical protein
MIDYEAMLKSFWGTPGTSDKDAALVREAGRVLTRGGKLSPELEFQMQGLALRLARMRRELQQRRQDLNGF